MGRLSSGSPGPAGYLEHPQDTPRLEKDERTLTEKATHLLAQCENVTIASIDADGYPRPVQMSKIHAKSFNEVWMATSVGSMKVNDFKANNKAGLCYDHYGDGVALRGTVEIITDDQQKALMKGKQRFSPEKK